ncbi:MAG: LuxR C-terminal-related transcriptional regulator [Spirochaetia bacterium]|nr:LuxR C-terminal-related transcriptional regulator [Spirochaetia bacterium]
MNEGLHRKVTLVSAAAGFGKTTLISEWVAETELPVAWVSLDEEHNDPSRFLVYLISAVQKLAPDTCTGVLHSLMSPQPPPADTAVTVVINELSQLSLRFVLVLDDYHVLNALPVDRVLTFLVENLPPRLHLVIASREDPPLPLPRLRAKGQLAEIRAAELRFLPGEAVELFTTLMGLRISENGMKALSARTEGWIAGLQLAAISLQGSQDPDQFVRAFTGSNRYILDYLVEEVLLQQSEEIQEFLLQTSILDRLCGPLCDAVYGNANIKGRDTLLYLERSNLFIVPLDDQRLWFRYHHLFAEFLQQRLLNKAGSISLEEKGIVKTLHVRASEWFEQNNYDLEAFQHAAAAMDIDRAAGLIEGKGMPLHLRGAVYPVLNWLESLSGKILKNRPVLNIMHASALLYVGKTGGVEEKLRMAEEVLRQEEQSERNRDLIGHIATIRASLALSRHDSEGIFLQTRRALEYLHQENIPVRTATTWLLGYAYHLSQDYDKALEHYNQAVLVSEKIGHFIVTISCYLGIGEIQELKGRLRKAKGTYVKILDIAGEYPMPVAAEAYMGLARISYEWNDLSAAEEYATAGTELAQQLENTDRPVACDVFWARLMCAKGDSTAALSLLREARETAREKGFSRILPEIVQARIELLVREKQISRAATLFDEALADEGLATEAHLLLCSTRLLLAQRQFSQALEKVNHYCSVMEKSFLSKEELQGALLLSAALYASGKPEEAQDLFNHLLIHCEAEGFIRSFVDQGQPADALLSKAIAQGITPQYAEKVLLAFHEVWQTDGAVDSVTEESMKTLDQLSPRELEVLALVARGLSNTEISEKLFISLSTVKGHNRQIFEKLQVNRRTEAVAKARELGLLYTE